MVGLIWFVQIVHYPLFARVGSEGYAAYQAGHMARTGPVVGPLMAVEAVTTAALALTRGGGLAWLGAGLLAVIWASTAFLQVPCHARLERSFDAATAARLVRSNWIRTVAWTARGGVALALLPIA